MLQGVLCQFQLVLQILANQSNADFKEQQLDSRVSHQQLLSHTGFSVDLQKISENSAS